jgi:hypothetical protein
MKRLILLFLLLPAAAWCGFGMQIIDGPVVVPGDTTPPELSSLTIPADGDTLIMELTEVCNTGSGFDATDLALTHTSTGVTVTALASGNGTDTWTFTLSGTIYDGETVTATWPGTSNGIEDTAGNDLASFSSQAVTNNSTQSAPSASCSTPSVLVSSTAEDASTDIEEGYRQRGQSFDSGAGGLLCSVTIKIASEQLDTGESGTLTCRVRGGNCDMASVYDAIGTLVVNNGTTGEVTIDLSASNYTMPASETQYVIFDWSGNGVTYNSTSDDDINIYRSNTSQITGQYFYNDTNPGWNCETTSGIENYDLYLKVNVAGE